MSYKNINVKRNEQKELIKTKKNDKPYTIIYDEDLNLNDIPMKSRYLLGFIRRKSKKYGYCNATNKYIAVNFLKCKSVSTVDRHLRVLREKGYIYIQHHVYYNELGNKCFERRIYLKELVCVEGGLSENYEKINNETEEQIRKEIIAEVDEQVKNECKLIKVENIVEYPEAEDKKDSEKLENPPELIEILKKNFGEKVYYAWFSNIVFFHENGGIGMAADNQFILDYVNRNYSHSLYKNGKLVRTGLLDILRKFYHKRN